MVRSGQLRKEEPTVSRNDPRLGPPALQGRMEQSTACCLCRDQGFVAGGGMQIYEGVFHQGPVEADATTPRVREKTSGAFAQEPSQLQRRCASGASGE